jgi:hypothetical protein
MVGISGISGLSDTEVCDVSATVQARMT